MKMAYADPPYLGCAAKLYGEHHPQAADYDRLETHASLIASLDAEYDGWAYSLSSPTLKNILPICPDGIRVGAWVKPFCAFKVNVNPAYAWEPVIFKGGRKRGRDRTTIRDFVSAEITLKRGLPGAKPASFAWWIFDLLGMEPDDDFVDVFPGSGAMGQAWSVYQRAARGFPLLLTEQTTEAT